MAILEAFPCLCVRDAEAAIHFHVTAFGGKELLRPAEPTRSA